MRTRLVRVLVAVCLAASGSLVVAAPPTASDFDLNPIPVNTVIVVEGADLVSSFATDADEQLDATSLDFDGATIDGVAVGSPADAGFSYTPGAGTAGEFTVDPTVAAFAGLTPGSSADVEVSYTVTDSDSDTDTGVLRYTVVGDPGPYDEVAFDHQGLPAGGVTAARSAGAGEALVSAVMAGSGTVESALAAYDFSAIVAPSATPGAETAIAIAQNGSTASAAAGEGSVASAGAENDSTAEASASDDSSSEASAENGSEASAEASNNSDALAIAQDDSGAEAASSDSSSASAAAETGSAATADALAGSTATAQAANTSSATAFAADDSVSSADADNDSTADAVTVGGSAASAVAAVNSDALAFAQDGSSAEATATTDSSSSASAETGSTAASTAEGESAATTQAVNTSSATAEAINLSVANAEGANMSTADAVATGGSAAAADAADSSDAFAEAIDGSATEAVATADSSASASAGTGSTSVAEAASGVTATSQASDGASTSVLAPAAVANPEIDDDGPSSADLRLPEELVAPANTETPLPFGVTGSGGAVDRVVLGGFPAGSTLSAGTEESPGVWAFNGPPPPGLSFSLPPDWTGNFLLDVRIDVANDQGFAQAPMSVTIQPLKAIPTMSGFVLVLLALMLIAGAKWGQLNLSRKMDRSR